MSFENKNIAVVLGGGGSKGAYQIGVWQALRELGVKFNVVTGSSVGALNGAFMAQGDFEEALYMWQNIDNTHIMKGIPSSKEKAETVYSAFLKSFLKEGGLDTTPLVEMINRLLDEDRVRESDVEFGLVTVEVNQMQPVEVFMPDIPKGQLPDYLLASASCFPAFKPHKVGDKYYIDGGYTDNIPVRLALRAKNTPEHIITVDLEGIGRVRKNDSDVPVTKIKCYWDLGNMLMFDAAVSRNNIRQGYLDTYKAFDLLDGFAYAFKKGEQEKLYSEYEERVIALYDLMFKRLFADKSSSFYDIIETRITDAAARRRQGITGDDIDLPLLLLTSAELAAEHLNIDHLKIYDHKELIDEIKNTLRLKRYEIFGDFDKRYSHGDISLAEMIKGLKPENAIIYLADALHEELVNDDEKFPTELAMGLFPQQMLAAMFIEIIEK